MPRKPRFHLPGVPLHIVQRGNNRQPVFFDADDYRAYLQWLQEGAERAGCDVHAYVLMTNHVHLLMTPSTETAPGQLMQYLGRRYVPYVNRRYRRSGTLWEGRYKSSLIQTDQYLLACYRYIELNPVRAGMVESPGGYPWSSYAVNAVGSADSFVVPHERYHALGRDAAARRIAYRLLFNGGIEDGEELERIRCAWQTGTPLGNDRFRAEIEATLGRTVGQTRRGRPSVISG